MNKRHRPLYTRTPEKCLTEYKWKLRKKYNLDFNQYASMFEEQNGLCAICKKASDRRLDVDHCHETGAVRGLLCNPCNRRLGSMAYLTKALEYLKHHDDKKQASN